MMATLLAVIRIERFYYGKTNIVQSSDDESEQGLELSGCDDSEKVADEVS